MKTWNLYLPIAAAALAIAPPTTPGLRAEQYALLAGVEDYSRVSGANNLPGCVNDVQAMRAMLEQKFGFPGAHVTVLTNAEVTKANLLARLRALVEKAGPGDAALFYYSGHGAQLPDLNDGDEDDNLDEALVTSDFNRKDPATWLLDDHLRGELSRLRTKRALVILDSCNSGTGTKDYVNKAIDAGFGAFATPGGSKEFEMPKGMGHVLIAACAARETSAMGQYGGVIRSLFTTALVNVLPGQTSTPLGQLRAALASEMGRLHADAARRQTPQIEGEADLSFAVLIGAAPGGATLAVAPNVAPVQTPSDGLPSAFPVSVTPDRRTYRPGDTMVATVVSARPGYLRLYYVDQRRDVTLIFPNRFQADNRIEGERRVEIGGSTSPFVFRMKEPGGTEMLLAAVAPEQFTDHAALDFSKEPFVQLGKVGSEKIPSLVKLCDLGVKIIVPEPQVPGAATTGGTSPVAPAQVGRAAAIYEITRSN